MDIDLTKSKDKRNSKPDAYNDNARMGTFLVHFSKYEHYDIMVI